MLGGGAALSEHEQALENHRARGIAKLSPFLVPRGMSSALSAGLAQAFGREACHVTLRGDAEPKSPPGAS